MAPNSADKINDALRRACLIGGNPLDAVCTTSVAAEILDLDQSQVRRLIRWGLIGAVRWGREWILVREDVNRYKALGYHERRGLRFERAVA